MLIRVLDIYFYFILGYDILKKEFDDKRSVGLCFEIRHFFSLVC